MNNLLDPWRDKIMSGIGWIPIHYEPDLVSVIIPVYNRAKLIHQTLESVGAQTYRPIELIVVDDGSTDETPRVVRQWFNTFAPKNELTCKLVNQNNAGAPVARNRGAKESRGEYIQFFDSDDIMLPEKITLQVYALKKSGKNWSGSFCKSLSVHSGYVADQCLMEKIIKYEKSANFVSIPLFTPSGIYRREFLRSIGPWNTTLKIMQDTEFRYRVMVSDKEGIWVPRVLTYIRDNNPSILRRNDIKKQSQDILYAIQTIENISMENNAKNSNLQANFGKRLSLCYREVVLTEEGDGEFLYQEALKRCAGLSAMKLRIFRMLYKIRLPGIKIGLLFLQRILGSHRKVIA